MPWVRVSIAVGVAASALAAGEAFAATGDLTGQGCIGDAVTNPDNCSVTTKGLAYANAIAASSDGKSVYATGYSAAIVTFKRNPTTGALASRGCIGDHDTNPANCPTVTKGLDATNGLTVAPDGKSVYVVSNPDNSITMFKRDRHTGKLTPKGCIGEHGTNYDNCGTAIHGIFAANGVVVSSDGKSVYVVSGANGVIHEDTILTFKRDPSTSKLTLKDCIGDTQGGFDTCHRTTHGLDDAAAVAVSPDDRSVYVASHGDDAVTVFKRDHSSGKLKPKSCIGDHDTNPANCPTTTAALTGADGIAISPDGKSVYAASGETDNAIVAFKRKHTGNLVPLGCIDGAATGADTCAASTHGMKGAAFAAISSDGKSVYLTPYFAGNPDVVFFKRNSTSGKLTAQSCVGDLGNNPANCATEVAGLDGVNGVVAVGRKSVYTISFNDNALVDFARTP